MSLFVCTSRRQRLAEDEFELEPKMQHNNQARRGRGLGYPQFYQRYLVVDSRQQAGLAGQDRGWPLT